MSLPPVPPGAAVTDPPPALPDVRAGLLAALIAYSLWGFLPLFFKLLDAVDPVLVVANRVVFSLVVVLVLLALRRSFGEVRAAFRNRRVVFAMLASTLLIAVNWLTFIWGVAQERVLEVSFGYFVNPLVSVVIGFALLGERFTRVQVAALALALVAVSMQAAGLGTVPWVALILAVTFGLYGYVRKVAAVNSATGLFVETLFLLPPAMALIGWQVGFGNAGGFYADPATALLLVLTGPVTAIPLVLFAFAARQLKLSTIGMFQYIAPSIQFVLAVFVFGEELSPLRLVSFGLIWVALLLFTGESVLRHRRAAAMAR